MKMIAGTKSVIAFCLLLFPFNGFSQTEKLSGTYSYGKSGEAAYGYLALYSKNDSILFFYIENGRGAPSYNSGSLDGVLQVKNDSGVFISNDTDWILHFHFLKNGVKIVSKEYKSGNGYGYGVDPDGEYTRISNKKPAYFINREGDTMYFNKYNQAR